VASSFKANFSDLYRSAFAETDPQVKQLLLRERQGVLDSWLFENTPNGSESPLRVIRLRELKRPPPHPGLIPK